jgi:hypothetical protein
MPPELERLEIAGYRDVFDAAPAHLVSELGIRWADVGGAACRAVAAAPGHRIVNHVAGLGLDESPSDTELLAIERFYAGTPYVVSLAPTTNGLGTRLNHRGLAMHNRWGKFVRSVGVSPLVRTDLRVAAVANTTQAAAFGEILVTSFFLPAAAAPWFAALCGRPGWFCYLAWDDTTPVAAAAMRCADGVGWLFGASTLPGHRGRGAQNALLRARLMEAQTRGCTTVMVEAATDEHGRPGASWRNIERAGFALAYTRPNLGIKRSPERH